MSPSATATFTDYFAEAEDLRVDRTDHNSIGYPCYRDMCSDLRR